MLVVYCTCVSLFIVPYIHTYTVVLLIPPLATEPKLLVPFPRKAVISFTAERAIRPSIPSGKSASNFASSRHRIHKVNHLAESITESTASITEFHRVDI
ncbi:hypothetical protein F4811DRAFT_538815 [Daldinia bambusicola]|nr:hypothetical protein F4811DRAFT_538815 [Daldinia bambusicola]